VPKTAPFSTLQRNKLKRVFFIAEPYTLKIMSKGISRFQNNILLTLERLMVVRDKMRARGVPMPDRISKRRLLEKVAEEYGRATVVRERSHTATRMVRGTVKTVRVLGRKHIRVDHTFANSFYRAVKRLNQKYGVDILSVYTPPTKKTVWRGFG